MNGAASGTSRRAFLGRAAGAAVAVGAAGVGAGAITGSAAAADQRTYTAGRFALDIDGVNVGLVAGVDGGDRCGNVVDDPPTSGDIVQRKHLAGVKYEDFTVQVGSAMGKPMYDWIKASFDKGYVRKSGAISAGDFNYKEKHRSEASTMSISSITCPPLDRSSTEPVYLPVDISCPKVTTVKPSGADIRGSLGSKQKAWLPSNFVFVVGGADTSRVASIDSFTWKCTVASDGSVLCDVSDIGVTFPQADVSSWRQWYQSMLSGADDERDGALTLIGAQGGVVCTFSFENLGLYRLLPTVNKRVKAEMYCERASWDLAKGKGS
ncbi:MAG TPA: hypothetical protein VGH79_03325 [Gaiellaceae bacterium]|jgi:hypothetical protein